MPESHERRHVAETMRHTPPWEAIGVSRATWYRHGKPRRRNRRRQPRGWQKVAALASGAPVRSLQRGGFVQRWAPELRPLIIAGQMRLGTAAKNRDAETRHGCHGGTRCCVVRTSNLRERRIWILRFHHQRNGDEA